MVEETNAIVTAISTVGFPIVACAALFWMINTTMKELTSAIRELSDSIKHGNSIKEGSNVG